MIKSVSTTSHLHFNKSSVRNSTVASATFVLDLHIEGAGAAADGLGKGVFADTIEMDHVAIEGSVVRITDSGAATESSVTSAAAHSLDENLATTASAADGIEDMLLSTETIAGTTSLDHTGLRTLCSMERFSMSIRTSGSQILNLLLRRRRTFWQMAP